MEKLEYQVIKNTNSMGHTNKESLADFDSAEDAVKFARTLKDTEYSWITVEINFKNHT